jgi:hypothetical protein
MSRPHSEREELISQAFVTLADTWSTSTTSSICWIG